jgi:hypothetical protein
MHAPHKEGIGMPPPLTDVDLDEIETEAKTNAAETYRGALLALVDEVRRLRGIVLEGRGEAEQHAQTDAS